jgi:rhodanese-related sulfurtransferase
MPNIKQAKGGFWMETLPEGVKHYFDDLKKGCNNLIDCKDLYKLIGAKEDLFILDIRRKEDFEKEHIEGAIHAEWEEVGELIENDILPKDKKIIVVCYSGQTAGQIVGILKILGYNVCSLKGGMMNGWLKDSLPIKSGCSL